MAFCTRRRATARPRGTLSLPQKERVLPKQHPRNHRPWSLSGACPLGLPGNDLAQSLLFLARRFLLGVRGILLRVRIRAIRCAIGGLAVRRLRPIHWFSRGARRSRSRWLA